MNEDKKREQGVCLSLGINPETSGCRTHLLDLLSFHNPNRLQRIALPKISGARKTTIAGFLAVRQTRDVVEQRPVSNPNLAISHC